MLDCTHTSTWLCLEEPPQTFCNLSAARQCPLVSPTLTWPVLTLEMFQQYQILVELKFDGSGGGSSWNHDTPKSLNPIKQLMLHLPIQIYGSSSPAPYECIACVPP